MNRPDVALKQGTYSKMQHKMLSNPLQVEGEGEGELERERERERERWWESNS